MVAGGVLAYLVLVPLIVHLGANLDQPVAPSTTKLIRDMSVGELRSNYILYIGAGAVATGGIISMLQAMPLIIASIRAAARHCGAAGNGKAPPCRACRAPAAICR